MELYTVKKYSGKKVYLFLKNNFRYTCILPTEIASDFSIIDKFGKTIEINCDFISSIQEVGNGR
jgi:hypothetical protein